MAVQEFITVRGTFSGLYIKLNQDVVNQLAVTSRKNPLKEIEEDLQKVLDKFERKYFELTHPVTETDDPVTTAATSDPDTTTKRVQNAKES